ncbi:uncharacterized protein LOC136033049 isoform X2 [Artemia franciscana]|uniref:Platelet-derived growth factor (PDGF) family profile domain-containing protein n=1 Tax=Artemia franciscana TaxID=6661 RepID=A0AA88II23_ARTSF|nr:hypothetical protein QYM36_001020 [Artemia franciscana]
MILLCIPTLIFIFFLDITYVRCSSGDYQEAFFNGATSDESEEEIQDTDLFLQDEIPQTIFSLEGLVLKMVREYGYEACTSPLGQAARKSSWRRSLDNTPEELEERNTLIQTCNQLEELEKILDDKSKKTNVPQDHQLQSFEVPLPPARPGPPKDFEAPTQVGPPGPSHHGGPLLFDSFGGILPQPLRRKPPPPGDPYGGARDNTRVWDVLAKPSPNVSARNFRSRDDSTVDFMSPTDEEKAEINAILRNKDTDCKPGQTSVPVPHDPDPGIQFFPKCLIANRCGGCCSHEALQCSPTTDGVEVVTRKVVAIQASRMFLRSIVLEEHSRCKCECRVKAKDCSSKQKYDSKSCACRCKKVMRCPKPQDWVERLCQCNCPERLMKNCATGMYYDTKKCKCLLGVSLLIKSLDRNYLSKDQSQKELF